MLLGCFAAGENPSAKHLSLKQVRDGMIIGKSLTYVKQLL